MNIYSSQGCFFVRVSVGTAGELILARNVRRNTGLPQGGGRPEAEESGEPLQSKDGRLTGKYQTRATMLFLAVWCLEISDILFAVDSLGAIVARVNHLLLAYTAAVFAMLPGGARNNRATWQQAAGRRPSARWSSGT